MSNNQEKLVFTLCRTCAEERNTETRCMHDITQRSITGVYTSVELNLALEHGYQIVDVYEVHLFDKRTDIFEQYVNVFYRIKTIYSGWDDVIAYMKVKQSERWQLYLQQTPNQDPMLCVERNPDLIADYCHEFTQRFCTLSPNDIQKQKNNALRTTAKVMLNSLYGKYGQRHISKQTITTKNPAEFYDHLRRFNDNQYDDFEYHLIHDSAIISFNKPLSATKDNKQINPYLAMFITAHARVHLYKLLKYHDQTVAYYDTDSVYFVEERGREPQFGVFLGEFTNELNGAKLVGEWFSTGPKCKYYTTTDTKKNKSIVPTCKGIAMTRTNAELYKENMYKLITQPEYSVSFDRGLVIDRNTLTGDLYSRVGKRHKNTQDIEKPSRVLKFINDKRICIKRYIRESKELVLVDSVPYGYKYNYEDWRYIEDEEEDEVMNV